MNRIIHSYFRKAFEEDENGICSLIYIDPPFNTGDTQKLGANSYKDLLENSMWLAMMADAFDKAYELLDDHGSLFVHVDWRCSWKIRFILENQLNWHFQNEIIWAYDYGGRSKKRYPRKHDNIYWYTKHPTNYTFNYDEIDRIPYMAPGLVGKEKAAKGKTITDCWWHTIVPTMGKERVGYPTQKPMGILERIVKVHSNPGDTVIDLFAGSGTTGDAAAKNGRNFVMVDSNEQAIEVMKKRLEYAEPNIEQKD